MAGNCPGRSLQWGAGHRAGSVPTPQASLSANGPWLRIREPVTWQVPKLVFELGNMGLAQAGTESDLYLSAPGQPHRGVWPTDVRGLSCPRRETGGGTPEPLGSWSPSPGGPSVCPSWVQPCGGAGSVGAVSSSLLAPLFNPLSLPSGSGVGCGWGCPSQGLWAFRFHREEDAQRPGR